MLFNSWNFLLFFPIVTTLYFLFSHPYRWFLLLVACCVFYMAFVPKYLLILAFLIIMDYIAAIMISRASQRNKKFFLILSIASTCSVLFAFKYFNFFTDNLSQLAAYFHWSYVLPSIQWLLPIGLSFHTFQSLSYVIEVYKGEQKVEHNLGIYALYVMFYPQLVAGPIERPQHMLHQFRQKHSFDYQRVVEGLLLMTWGLFKKVVIADNLAVLVTQVYNQPMNYHAEALLLATVFFSIQIYCDFSGYTDIARGAAKVMGFDLSINFNHPYIAQSLSEFWRRWHISLSSWLRDYVYTPIILNRRYWGVWGAVYALMVTFAISGIWHGASWTFVAWGVLHGVGLSLEAITVKQRKKYARLLPPKLYAGLSLAFTFSFVTLSYVFFRAQNIHDALYILSNIWGPFHLATIKTVWHMKEVYFAFVAIAVLQTVEYFQRHVTFQEVLQLRWWYRWPVYYAIVATMLINGEWFTARQFIYFQF